MNYYKDNLRMISLVLLGLYCGLVDAQGTVPVGQSLIPPSQPTAPGANEPDLCPQPDLTPTRLTIEAGRDPKYVDKDRDLKNVGTDIVVQRFFNTPDKLFNFMKLVYGNINKALSNYKKVNKLEERSIFLLFKGGNVLRIVANGLFDHIPPEQRNFLKKEYAPDFKRSDADFSVYIDDKKINNYNYDILFDQVANVIYLELNKIRDEFQANPQKYFNLLGLKREVAQAELAKHFEELSKLPAVEDKTNDNWYQAKFKQLQLLDMQAVPAKLCDYKGQLDYKFVKKDSDVEGIPLTNKPNWIVNSDNRVLEWAWGSDPKKLVKFALVRSKVAFEYTYEKDGKIVRQPIGGELIDVSIPHRKDDRLREFLDNYDKTVARYTLVSEALDDKFTMKAYSLENLAEDLQFIIFDSFDRPWNGGPKYAKRINRLFFLYIVEMLGTYGLGSKKAKEYIADVKKNILEPLEKLYPLGDESEALAKTEVDNAKKLKSDWPELVRTNDFWRALGALINNHLIPAPLDKDADGFKEFLEAINKNIERIETLNTMPLLKIEPEEVYKSDMTMLF